MKPLSVVLADDSLVCRERLRTILEAENDLRVVAEAASGAEAVPLVQEHTPSVLVTDLVMPQVGGLEVVEQVMAECPLPIVVVTGRPAVDSTAAFEAIRRGALEFALKPALGDKAAEATLRQVLRRVAQVLVVRHPRVFRVPTLGGATTGPSWRGARPVVVGIGASAGGPPALAALLGALPPRFGSCIAIAQHLPPGYADGFARFLQSRCALEVEVCKRPTPIRPGLVLVASDSFDLVAIDSGRLGPAPPQSKLGLAPSVDALLSSLATHLKASAAGIVLSGIGEDGALGLAALHRCGALTLVQDASSSAVYGMPKAAAPAARWELTPEEIGHFLCRSLPLRTASPGW